VRMSRKRISNVRYGRAYLALDFFGSFLYQDKKNMILKNDRSETKRTVT